MRSQCKIQEKFRAGKKKFIIALIAVIVGLAIIFSCFYIWQQQVDKSSFVPVVKVAKVKKQDLTAIIRTSGILQCIKQRDVAAKTTSLVKETRKTEGAKVTMGEVVLLLDNSQALVKLGEAENRLAVLQGDYLQAVSDKVFLMTKRDDLRKNLPRLEELYNLGAVSLRDVEVAKLEVANLENQIVSINLNTLESQVNRGRLAVQTAREQLAATVVTSPLEGTILKMAAKNGEAVRKGNTLFSIGQTASLEVVASLSEKDALKVQNGQEVEIYSEAFPEKVFKGRVSQIAPQAEVEQTALGSENKVKVQITLEEKAEELKPGFSVNVHILLEAKPEVLTVPLEAVTEVNGKSVVFVYEEGLAVRREIQKGLESADWQEIRAGLAEEEEVIISSLEQIQDSTKVKVEDES